MVSREHMFSASRISNENFLEKRENVAVKSFFFVLFNLSSSGQGRSVRVAAINPEFLKYFFKITQHS
jgi:hypothetical protein